jgi:hypothetical protein
MKGYHLGSLSKKTGQGVPQLFTWHKPKVTSGELTEDQLAAFEARLENPVEDVLVSAPVTSGQRLTISGTVKRMRLEETMYGSKNSLTVRMESPHGIWFAVGSCPHTLMEARSGDRVQLDVTIKKVHKEKPYFAYYRRPTKGVLIERYLEPDLTSMLKDKYGLEQDFTVEVVESKDPFDRGVVQRGRKRAKPVRFVKKKEG